VATADERISRLEAQVARLLEVLAARDAEIARLKGRVAELERQLGQNSTNSHKPPSSDPPGTRPSKEASGRKRGGQAGHKGHKRVLLPAEKVTKRTEVRPRACHGCGGHDLTPSELAPRIHQVVDIPEIRPDVHEVRMHAASCRGCGRTTWARLPGKVPAHMFGPRLQAFIGYLIGSRMSRRQVRELLGEVFGIPVSLGALSEAEARTSAALAEPVAEAEAYVRAQPVKHVDTSTWRLHGKYAALWTITTRFVAAFFVARDATRETIAALIGTLSGVLVTDRGSQFGFWAMPARQVCWAHLIRKFVSFSQRKDEGAQIGDNLLLLAHAMLCGWHRVRDGTLSRRRYQRMVREVLPALELHLDRGVALDVSEISGACRNILEHKAALFTFAFVDGVDPTNNAAERALRPFVLWRKVSYGSQSLRGCLFAQRIMTVVHSLRLQKRSVWTFLRQACSGTKAGSPSLLPVH
jgi:transposase